MTGYAVRPGPNSAVDMRYLFVVACLLVLLLGLLFGALNPQPITIDLYLREIDVRLGVALLLAVLIGAVLGGICAAIAFALRQRRRMTRRDDDVKALDVVDQNEPL